MDKPIERIVLSQEDSEIFLATLRNPPEPSEKLKAAARDYTEHHAHTAEDTELIECLLYAWQHNEQSTL